MKNRGSLGAEWLGSDGRGQAGHGLAGILHQIAALVADGISAAAEVVCPRDHSCEDRLRSWESAAVAVEGEICDEAEACEGVDLLCTCGHPSGDHYRAGGLIDPCGKCDCLDLTYKSSAAVSAAADPSPADDHHALRGAGDEGPEGASAIPPAAPSGQPNDEWDPIATLAELREAVGTVGAELLEDDVLAQRFRDLADQLDPGEVSRPSPGEQVRDDDLAAHILASAGYRRYDLTRAADAAARSLLTDFNITRK